jgi:predicted alpha/beta-fold hydrolase
LPKSKNTPPLAQIALYRIEKVFAQQGPMSWNLHAPSRKIANFTSKYATLNTKRITFQNKQGLSLSARLELPHSVPPHHFAIFAHCFTCGKGIKAATLISRALTLSGFAVLRFDFTGLGQSEGDFAETGFTSNIDDLVAAAAHLSEHYQAPRLLIGHSLGGTAVLHASAKIDSIEAVVSIGAPFEARHVARLFSDGEADILKHGKATVDIGGGHLRLAVISSTTSSGTPRPACCPLCGKHY